MHLDSFFVRQEARGELHFLLPVVGKNLWHLDGLGEVNKVSIDVTGGISRANRGENLSRLEHRLRELCIVHL